MVRERWVQSGLWVAGAGLGVALLSLVPQIGGGLPLPWPLLLGSSVYLCGAIAVVANARGPGGKALVGKLRLIRFGFIAIVLILIVKMQTG